MSALTAIAWPPCPIVLPYPVQTNRRVAVIVTFLEEMDEKAGNK
jgi:hypothetical protein